jgi:hypothetical protein
MMRISLINFSPIPDENLQAVIRVINRQIRDDFEPYWGMSASLRLEGKSTFRPRLQSAVDMRGDAVLYLTNTGNVNGLLGYHALNFPGIPYGCVFTWISRQLGESWTVTLSHEALELVGDPEANRLATGPHPQHPELQVFYWYEMCDAVQNEIYEIDGVEVSNFVLPLYFTPPNEPGSRNDFLGRLPALPSFGVAPGGYVGFVSPWTGANNTYAPDRLGRARSRIKGEAGQASRLSRYQKLGTRAARLEYLWRGTVT